jgi:DNA-directed RNA polymerase subunit RPC12/RpoP
MFGRIFGIYCWDCGSKFRFKSHKELDAFKLGSKGTCPDCGELLSPFPIMSQMPPLPPIKPPREV